METKRLMLASLSGILFGVIIIGTLLYGIYLGKGGNETKDLEELRLEGIRVNTNKIVAVDNDNKGVVADLITEVRPGSGLVLVNINNVLADINTQYSARLAVKVAKEYTKKDLSNVDIIFNVKANAGIVGGQSAGSTMALALIATLEEKTVPEDIIMTGSIEGDGHLGNAGKIYEKAQAAKEAGAKIFLIPPASSEENAVYKRDKKCVTYGEKEFCEIRYNQDTEAFNEALGIRVVEVRTIEEALKYYFPDDTQTTV